MSPKHSCDNRNHETASLSLKSAEKPQFVEKQFANEFFCALSFNFGTTDDIGHWKLWNNIEDRKKLFNIFRFVVKFAASLTYPQKVSAAICKMGVVRGQVARLLAIFVCGFYTRRSDYRSTKVSVESQSVRTIVTSLDGRVRHHILFHLLLRH